MFLTQRRDESITALRWVQDFTSLFWLVALVICTISSALAIAQALGWHPLPQWQPDQSPGLFFNPVHAGQTLAIVAVAFYAHRLYWTTPLLAPGLYLAHSRGAWLALAFGIIATHFRQPLWLLAGALAVGLAATHLAGPSDIQRLDIWRAAIANFAIWGNGFGSFWNLYMGDPTCCLVHPEYAHNDYLQTVFEFGIWSVIPFAGVAWVASYTGVRDWPILATFLLIACYSMPLHMPLLAAAGVVSFLTITMESIHA